MKRPSDLFYRFCFLLGGSPEGYVLCPVEKYLGEKKTVVNLILCQNEAMQTLNMPNISHSVMDLIPNSSMILYFAGLIDCFCFFKFICAFLLLQLFLGDF